MDQAADIVIAGAGLSAQLVALRLAPQARVLMIDRHPDPLAGHTWSFHDGDIDADAQAWLAPAIRRRWAGQEVRFPGHARRLASGYASLDAGSLGAATTALPGVSMIEGRVRDIDGRSVTLDDGRRIAAGVAIDARGFRPHPAAQVRFQKFLGQEVELSSPHGLTRPVIMDATVAQQDGYRFFYLLPFDDRRLLIEDTYYSDAAALSADRQRTAIADYAAARGWQIARVLREERGVLPITLRLDAEAFWRDRPTGLPVIGLRALRFHSLTGYSLPHAVRSAELVARHWQAGPETLAGALRRDSLADARRQGFYRLLARMLFEAAAPDERRRVMERFYRLPEPLIERFYAGQTSLADKARILTGRPPVPVSRALRCLPGTLKERSA